MQNYTKYFINLFKQLHHQIDIFETFVKRSYWDSLWILCVKSKTKINFNEASPSFCADGVSTKIDFKDSFSEEKQTLDERTMESQLSWFYAKCQNKVKIQTAGCYLKKRRIYVTKSTETEKITPFSQTEVVSTSIFT